MYMAIAIGDTGGRRAGGKWGQWVINKPSLNDIKIFLYIALNQIFISINLALNPSFFRLFSLYFNYPLRGYKRKIIYEEMEDRFFDVQNLAKYIHLSKSIIYRMVRTQSIPYIKLGTRTLFERNQIDNWVINGGRVGGELPNLPQY